MAVTDEGMRFLLEADVNQFERGMNNAQTAAQNAAKGIVAAGVRIQGASNYVDALQKDLKGLVAGLRTGETQFVSTGMAVNRAGQVVEQFGRNVASVGPNVKAMSGVTNSFNQLLRETPNFAINAQIGVLALSNNIPIFVDAVNSAVRAGGGFISILKGIGASLFSIGGIIQLGVTLVTIFSKELFGTEKAAKDAGDEIKKLSDIQKDYNKTVQSSNADTLKEVATLNELFRIAQDETRSRKDRTSALRELKSATDGYLDSLTLETINTNKAKLALDEFNKSLFISAVIKSNEKLVQDLADTYGRLAQQGIDGKKRIDELNKAIAEANKPGGDIEGESRFDRVVRLSKERTQLILETNKAINEQNKAYDQILATGTKIAQLQVQLSPFTKETNSNKGKKDILTISDVLKTLQNELRAIDDYNKLVGLSSDNLAGEKLKALNKSFENIAKIGGADALAQLKKIKSQIDLLGASVIGEKKINTKQILKFDKQTIKDPFSTENIERLVVTIPIDYRIDTSKALQNIKQLRPVLNELGDLARIEALQAAAKFQEAIEKGTNNAIQNGVSNLGSSFATAIGEMVAGGKGLKSAFDGIIGVFASFLKQLGESMIAAGTATIAAKLLIKNPYTAVAAGIVAVAAGAAIQASINKAPSFATGGTVYGSQMIQAGDNTTQKEHILSDLQLKKIAQGAGIGGGGTIIAETRVSGTDLVILLKQAEGSIASING